MYKNILVTGGSGLVGAALRSIADQYKKVNFIFSSSKLCDLRRQESVIKYVKRIKPDAIIHLAAACGGIALSMKYPATLLRDNVLMDINILEASRVCQVKKTVMSLSTGMYSSQVPMPIREEYIHNGPAHDSNYSYAFAKRLIDPMIRAYRAEYGMNVIGLIPNGIFGENSNFRPDVSTMLPALIRRLYENKNNKKKIIVWGDGAPLRELTYAKDMARAYMWCLENYNLGQIMHIGTTEEYSIKEIVFMAAEIMDIDKARIEFDTTKPSGQFRKSTDNSKFIALSGFKYTPFREGLENTINWFCVNYSKKGKIRK